MSAEKKKTKVEELYKCKVLFLERENKVRIVSYDLDLFHDFATH